MRYVVSMLLVCAAVATAVVLYLTKPRTKKEHPPRPIPLVRTVALRRTSEPVTIEAYGTVIPARQLTLQAQVEGPASGANMSLYANQAELNQAWGQTTVQARVQNQLYQQAAQSNLASGANVVNNGGHAVAQVASQNIDLSLLGAQKEDDGPITYEWIDRNLEIDRYVDFGSQEYFALAGDPALRPLLQSGPNVIFAHQGQVFAVQEPEGPGQSHTPDHPTVVQTAPEGNSLFRQRSMLSGLYSWISQALRQQR